MVQHYPTTFGGGVMRTQLTSENVMSILAVLVTVFVTSFSTYANAVTPPAPFDTRFDNFPVKSFGSSWAAQSYILIQPDDMGAPNLEDPHPVHGTSITAGANAGGVAFAGKALNRVALAGTSTHIGFLLILDDKDRVKWTWTPPGNRASALNAVVEVPGSSGLLLAVGFQTDSSNVSRRSLTLIDSNAATSAAAVRWTKMDFTGDGPNSHGAWEMADFTSDGTGVLLAGLTSSENTDEFTFKSYGNVPSGAATVMEISTSSIINASTPADLSIIWTKSWALESGKATAKAARAVGADVAVLTWGEEEQATVTLFGPNTGADRSQKWERKLSDIHGEGTDIAVSADKSSLVVTGHGDPLASGALQGMLTKIAVSDGSTIFSRGYMSCDASMYATCKFIKNECWGVLALSNGSYVLSCGTGIENCVGMSGSLKNDCQADRPLAVDPRPGAIARPPSVWQSYVLYISSNGDLVWSRADAKRFEDAQHFSSASEYVFLLPSGDLGLVNDEVLGCGYLRLLKPLSPTPTPSTPDPTPIPSTPDPTPTPSTPDPTPTPSTPDPTPTTTTPVSYPQSSSSTSNSPLIQPSATNVSYIPVQKTDNKDTSTLPIAVGVSCGAAALIIGIACYMMMSKPKTVFSKV